MRHGKHTGQNRVPRPPEDKGSQQRPASNREQAGNSVHKLNRSIFIDRPAKNPATYKPSGGGL